VTLKDVGIARLDPGRFQAVLDPEDCRRLLGRLARAAERLAGRRLWQVNSTEQGGGVAEMLQFLLGYLAGAGIDTRWVVIEGNQEFFEVTKRVHHLLHGQPGDGGELDEPARASYRQTLKEPLGELQPRVEPGDVVVLHDPQTAGLAPALKQQGATVIWSCHVGIDQPNDLARTAWEFLRPAVQQADAYVFSRSAHCWEGLDRARLAVIAPLIDQPIPPSAPLVVQVSRWDPLKDPLGVLQGFSRHVPHELGAHLLLAGPATASVSDDPEGDQVLQQVRRAGAALPRADRDRVHLACLPMEDLEENAAMVNAIQRRADVIVQKSLAEGFGLTVAEAMWKARPVLASRVGGIQDQIRHGTSGLLLEDPSDLVGFGRAIRTLLTDRDQAQRLGVAAHRRVGQEYLAPRRLTQELDLIDRVAG
jgi:trehalose synthase